jgi:hypothetical protein
MRTKRRPSKKISFLSTLDRMACGLQTRRRKQRGGADDEEFTNIIMNESGANLNEGLYKTTTRREAPVPIPETQTFVSSGYPANVITTANNNNNTRRRVRSRLMAFSQKLKTTVSGPSGASGPVYDRDLLIDQLFVLNNALQPLRAIVREADDLMDMVKSGSAGFVREKNSNTDQLVQERIKKKVHAKTKKMSKNKKLKAKNIEKLFGI